MFTQTSSDASRHMFAEPGDREQQSRPGAGCDLFNLLLLELPLALP